jgi:Protoheme ferro-lyase (ferrochelatase)
VRKLAKEGVKNLAVITPGFSADCLETLEEIAFENAHIFKKHGGQNFAAHPLSQRQRAGDGGDPPARGASFRGWV